MLERLLWFLPPGTEILFLIGVAFALMLGLVTLRRAKALVLGLVLMCMAAPFVDSLLMALPWWLSTLVIVGFTAAMIREAMQLFMGRHVGGRLFDRFAVWLISLPFRLLARSTWGLTRRVAGRATDRWLDRRPRDSWQDRVDWQDHDEEDWR